MNDEVSIVVGSEKIAHWLSVSITRSVEMCPNHFQFALAETEEDPTKILVVPGKGVCQIFIGDDLVLTGYVDRYSSSFAPGVHEASIVGRGLCADLIDCSADLLRPDSPVVNGQVSASSALDLAQKLAQPQKVAVRCPVDDKGPPIQLFQVALGETPYEIIERVSRYAGFLVYEDEKGALVLDRIGTHKMASGFAQGINVEAAATSLSVDQRFSDYCVVWSTINQVSDGPDSNIALQRATASDAAFKQELGRYRPKIIVSAQTDIRSPGDYAQRLADWTMARAIGRSQAVQLTCDSWRDSAGALWQPNSLAIVNLPRLKLVNAEWVIATVTFRKDGSGTHADLVLMPKNAFSIQPTTLQLYDTEIAAGTPKS